MASGLQSLPTSRILGASFTRRIRGTASPKPDPDMCLISRNEWSPNGGNANGPWSLLLSCPLDGEAYAFPPPACPMLEQHPGAGSSSDQTTSEGQAGLSFHAARRTIQGYEATHMIRKGQSQRVNSSDVRRRMASRLTASRPGGRAFLLCLKTGLRAKRRTYRVLVQIGLSER